MAIPMTFLGQVLLSTDTSNPAPFFPYGIWVIAALTLSLVPIALFKGKCHRLDLDTFGSK